MNTDLTVIMSVYNGEKYLTQSINSILNQSYKNFKFFIVDNGSNDSTSSILDHFKHKDQRIKIFTNPNKNQTYVEGREIAIKKITTKWFALMDADDISHINRLEIQMDYLSRYKNIGAISTWGKYINSTNKILGSIRTEPVTIKNFYQLKSKNKPIILLDPASIINYEAYKKAGGYRSDCVPAADLDLWYRISETGMRLMIIPKFLFFYRVHDHSLSVSKTLQQRKKTHFINYNMRKRRSGKKEISFNTFEKDIWSNLFYKWPRLRRDFILFLYKSCGLYYAQRQWMMFLIMLFVVFMLSPKITIKRVLNQL